MDYYGSIEPTGTASLPLVEGDRWFNDGVTPAIEMRWEVGVEVPLCESPAGIARMAYQKISSSQPSIGSGEGAHPSGWMLTPPTTMTDVSLPIDSDWVSVAYGNGIFVAITSDDPCYAAVSSDGQVWTLSPRIYISSYKKLMSITFGNGMFIALADYPHSAAGTEKSDVCTSTDGINWTVNEFDAGTGRQLSVAYGNGVFVSVGVGSYSMYTNSYDASIWTRHNMPSSTVWNGIAFGNGLFVATGTGIKMAWSTNGQNWTAATVLSGNTWLSVAFGDNYFVAVSSNSNKTARTSNGIDWYPYTLPATRNWKSIAYGNNIWVAVADLTDKAAVSFDNGVTWTETTMTDVANWQSVTYGSGRFTAIATFNDKVSVSFDGVTWQNQLPVEDPTHWAALGSYFDGAWYWGTAFNHSGDVIPTWAAWDGILGFYPNAPSIAICSMIPNTVRLLTLWVDVNSPHSAYGYHGFQVFDASGKLTYSSTDITWNYIGSYIAAANTTQSFTNVLSYPERTVTRQLLDNISPQYESYVHTYQLSGTTLTATAPSSTNTARTLFLVFGR